MWSLYVKERDYHHATPPRDTRRTSPRHSFPTIKVLAYNINNVFPYGNNVKCCMSLACVPGSSTHVN